MIPPYQPLARMYYCHTVPPPSGSDTRIVPTPDITIATKFNYSNDTMVGYTYEITFTGIVSALDASKATSDTDYKPFGGTIDNIGKLRNRLAANGSSLYVMDKEDNPILKATGGILRSFNVDESTNNMVVTVNFTAVIEFQSLEMGSAAADTEDCENPLIDPSGYPAGKPGIVDLAKFKIKSFEDNWSFTFDEIEAFNKIKLNELGFNMDINNSSFNVQYTISAVGQDFYKEDGTGPYKLIPSWEQAKNFVQYRLYKQAKNLIDNILKNQGAENGCSPSGALNNIQTPGVGVSGLLSGFDAKYSVYNETINCDTSQSDGSFSATYNALVKWNINGTYSLPAATHNVSKSVSTSYDGNTAKKSINIEGKIEGLIAGGLINTPGILSLPEKGSLLICSGSTLTTKYSNAKFLLDKLYDPTMHDAGIGPRGKRDFKKGYKDILGIAIDLGGSSSGSCSDERADPPHPSSFNLTHDYIQGTINYSITYDNTSQCCRKMRDVTIDTKEPTKILAIFNVPNSYSCPIIQDIGTKTAKTITITIQGTDLTEDGMPGTVNLTTLATRQSCSVDDYLPIGLPDGIFTQKQYTHNPLDGSFTINAAYICAGSGCSLESNCP